MTGRELGLPDIGVEGTAIPEPKRFRRAGNAGGVVLHLEDASLASRYMGLVIRGLRVGPSPEWLVERLAAVRVTAREVRREGHIVHVRPEVVAEIAFNDVQVSPQYPGGVALRFARVKGYRPDKTAADADTIDAVRALLPDESAHEK